MKMCSFPCKTTLSGARWGSAKPWIAEPCVLQKQWECLSSTPLFPSCIFVCFSVKPFLGGVFLDITLLSTDLEGHQPAPQKHLTCSGCVLTISLWPASHSWSRHPIFCTCSLHASNYHMGQTEQAEHPCFTL